MNEEQTVIGNHEKAFPKGGLKELRVHSRSLGKRHQPGFKREDVSVLRFRKDILCFSFSSVYNSFNNRFLSAE